jgi:hypothetical protein
MLTVLVNAGWYLLYISLRSSRPCQPSLFGLPVLLVASTFVTEPYYLDIFDITVVIYNTYAYCI